MGMTIDEVIDRLRKYQKLVNENKQLSASITMMQADYNARLKDDMAAILTELSMKISEIVEIRQRLGRINRYANKFKFWEEKHHENRSN